MREHRAAPSGPPERLRHRPGVRRLLSLLFVLNFGSVGVYLMPGEDVEAGLLPDPAEDVLGTVLPPVKRSALPVARPWLDATATRQHWTLFAPNPSRWNAELRAVAWYPREPGDAAGGAGSAGRGAHRPRPPTALTPEGRPVTWTADTLEVVQGSADPYPHWLQHRRYRIAFNMGYEDWGRFYRPVHARWLCRTRPDERGVPPDGVEMTVVWRPMRVPWEEPPADTAYHQFLGGFTCHELLGEEAPSYFRAGQRPGPGRPAGTDEADRPGGGGSGASVAAPAEARPGRGGSGRSGRP